MNWIEWSSLLIIGLALLLWVIWDIRPWRRGTEFTEKTETLNIGEWSIRYHRSGRGPYLILIHGIGANLFCWRWLIPLLNDRFTVIAFDLPGFGQSSKPLSARYSLEDQTDRVRDIMAAMGIGQAYLVGNSMGGNIALWLARQYPDLVRAVCVIAPATSPRLVPVSLHRLAFASGALSLLLTRTAMRVVHRRTVSRRERLSQERIEESFRTYGRQPEAVRSFMLATETIRDPRLPEALSTLKVPTLILWGSKDKLVPRKVIDDLLKALPDAESEVHIGGGHHLQEDEPEWVAEKISTFFLQ